MNKILDQSQGFLFTPGIVATSQLLSYKGEISVSETVLTRAQLTALRRVPVFDDLINTLTGGGKIKGQVSLGAFTDHAPTQTALPRIRKYRRHYLQISLRLSVDVLHPLPKGESGG